MHQTGYYSGYVIVQVAPATITLYMRRRVEDPRILFCPLSFTTVLKCPITGALGENCSLHVLGVTDPVTRTIA